jgi:hypothetical protein
MHRLLIVCLLLIACSADTPTAERIEAARALTTQCSRPPISEWRLRATVAGRDCDVLLVHVAIPLDSTMVEVVHYGTGDSPVSDGGIEKFSRLQRFRGVAYRDSNRSLWTYGALTEDEVPSLPPCH